MCRLDWRGGAAIGARVPPDKKKPRHPLNVAALGASAVGSGFL